MLVSEISCGESANPADQDVVDNDFHASDAIFKLFDGLEVDKLDDKVDVPSNGVHKHEVNGTHSSGD